MTGDAAAGAGDAGQPAPAAGCGCPRGRAQLREQLARELGISRALLQVHLRKLQAAGLVSATIEVSEDGKAMKFYEVMPFTLHLTPKAIMVAARSLGAESDLEAEVR